MSVVVSVFGIGLYFNANDSHNTGGTLNFLSSIWKKHFSDM